MSEQERIVNYRKRTVFILFTALLVRFWLSQIAPLELTGPEAYSWLKGKYLDWGYYDQGPLVPWLVQLGTWFFHDTVLGVRWIAAAIYTGTGFILFYLTRAWYGARVAFWSVVIYLVLPVYAWPTLLMTDGTANLGLMALTLLAYHFILEKGTWWAWALGGAVSGVALLVSWTNGWWLAGFLLYFFLDPARKRQWRSLQPLAGVASLLFCLLPVWFWYQKPAVRDLQFTEQAALYTDTGLGSIRALLSLAAEQFLLWSPGLFLAVVAILYVSRRFIWRDKRHGLLLAVALPGLIFQICAALFHSADADALPALYLPVAILAGHLGLERIHKRPGWTRIGLFLLVLAALQSVLGLVPQTANRTWLLQSGLYSPISKRSLALEVARQQKERGATIVIANRPETASLLSFYLAYQPQVHVVRNTIPRSQFDFWADYSDFYGYSALYITPSKQALPAQLQREFRKVTPLEEALVPGDRSRYWEFYLCEDYGGVKEEPVP
jgi:4-amino-4-deoxy-L-arabinose transferase-like glycosyltransferase